MDSALTVVTKESVEDFINENEVTVLYFWHPVCLGCVDILPEIEKIAREYSGRVSFGSVNTDLHGEMDPEIVEKMKVDSTPTVIVTWMGQLVAYFYMTSEITPKAIRLVLEHHYKTID